MAFLRISAYSRLKLLLRLPAILLSLCLFAAILFLSVDGQAWWRTGLAACGSLVLLAFSLAPLFPRAPGSVRTVGDFASRFVLWPLLIVFAWFVFR